MRVLIVSGLDPSGGAGFIQDIKVLSGFGHEVYGVIAAFTVQNMRLVKKVYFRTLEELKEELSLLHDPDIVKVGLASPEIVKMLRFRFPHAVIVWNVILRSSSGCDFLKPDAVKRSLDFADYVILNEEEYKEIGEEREHFLVTCKNLMENKVVVRYKDKEFENPMVKGDFHGTGCAFSSAFAAYLAMRYPPEEAIRSAMSFMMEVLRVSDGYVTTERILRGWIERATLKELTDILEEFLRIAPKTVPEVGQNISYALPWARNEEEVAKIPGRIRLCGDRAIIVSSPSFEGRSHTARMVLEMMRKYPYIRCATNVRYEPGYVEKAKKMGLKTFKLDRSEEPENIRRAEGESLKWAISRAVMLSSTPPDLIWDEGFWGKEAMIRVFGRTPREVLEKVESFL